MEIANDKNLGAILLDDMADFQEKWLKDKKNIGITAGASAPEILVQELVKEIKKIKQISISEIKGIEENIIFKLPKI
jgi:4-hydroxy-3-methylbut-2-enyl diphosphate reductase